MSLLPSELARRIDRLAIRAHAFHRFAHHPLCGAYSGELVALGRRTRVCRGCTLSGLGLVAGAVTSLFLAPHVGVAAGCGTVASALACLSLRMRVPKVLGRFVPGALGTVALVGAVRTVSAWLLAAAAVGAASLFAAYRRRGPHRSPCTSCPERLLSVPCSGFLPIVRREQAFQRLSLRWVDAAAPESSD